MSDLVARMKQALDKENLSWSASAVLIGKSAQAAAKWKKGQIGRDTLQDFAEATKVSYAWLETGEGQMLTNRQQVDELVASLPSGITHEQIEPWRIDNQIFIEFYDVRFCCGNGSAQPEFEALKKTLPFDISFFRRRGIIPDNLKMIYATGDSMSNYINEGDAVGIDIGDVTPKDGEVYALFLDGDLMIKRIFKEAGGVVRLSSDNKQYADKIVTQDNGDSLIIIGRVVYRSG